MDVAERLNRLEDLLVEQQDRGLAAEIVAHLFYARLLNVSQMIGDPMDLDAAIARLREDMAEAEISAESPARSASWRRVGARAIGLVEQIRDMRLAFQPANENGAS